MFSKSRNSNFLIWGVAALLAICFVMACSPSVKNEVDLSKVKIVSKEKSTGSSGAESAVFVDLFTDKRDSKAVVIKGTKESNLKNDPGKIVRKAVSTALENEGFEITDEAPLIISGSVKKWQANIEGGFSSTVRSDAKIMLEVFDPANKPVYRGVYNGFSEQSHPSLNSKDVNEALAQSLREAIKQITVDKKLIGVLTSF